ncbi:glycosyltransferase, partial [Roseateles sp. GG27B]
MTTIRGVPNLMSVVLPAFNEALNLQWLLPELCTQLQGMARRIELLVIDDGSSDDTALLVHGLIQQG